MAAGPAAAEAHPVEVPVAVGKIKLKQINADKIEQAVADLEGSVDFELVPVIADKSSYVAHIPWLISLLLMVFFIGLIDWVFTGILHDSWMTKTPFYVAIPFLSIFFGVLLDKSDRIDRFFIPLEERRRQCLEKAELYFYRQRWHELKSKNALMLYISVMERQIVLFHDPRMQSAEIPRLEAEVLAILQASFKKHDFESGLLKAIEHLKQGLEPHYARSGAEPQNVVPNKLIWLRD